MRRRITGVAALSLLLGLVFVQQLEAVTVNVSATATGGFGGPNTDGFTNFVPGFTFTGAQTVDVSASDTIDIAPVAGFTDVPPNGITFGAGASPSDIFPLEEGFNDGGGIPPITGPEATPNVGALIGAFVPESVVNSAGFQPRDEDLGSPGVPSTSLFLIGSGPFSFSAPGAGVLYLGINDTRADNNAGAFVVELVPEPSSLAFLLVAGAAFVGYGWRRKR